MLISSEIKKLSLIRFVSVTFLLIFLLNGILCFVEARRSESENTFDSDTLSRVYEAYAADPDGVEAYYSELSAYRRESQKRKKEVESAGGEYIETRAAVYTDGLYNEDIKLIQAVQQAIKKNLAFERETAQYIANAKNNYNEYLLLGMSEDAYECRYQLRAEKLYTDVLDKVELSLVLTRGWEDFYGFGLCGILSLVFAIAIGTVVFTYENDCGMSPLIRSVKRGRGPTSAAKIITVLLLSALATAVLTLEALAVFAAAQGLSDPTQPLQSADIFRRSPLIVSLGGYLPVFLGQRILASLICTTVAALISVLIGNSMISFVAAAALTGLNFALYYSGTGVIKKASYYLNLISLSGGVRLCERYNALGISGEPVDYLPFLVCASLLIVLICALAAAVTYAKTSPGNRFRVAFRPLRKAAELWNTICSKLCTSVKKRQKVKSRSFSLSLRSYELTKLWLTMRTGILALLLVAAGVLFFARSDVIKSKPSYIDKIYDDYIAHYEGEWTEQKHEEISEAYYNAASITSKFQDMQKAYQNKQITYEELSAYNELYSTANIELTALERLLGHSQYLGIVSEGADVPAEFFNDKAWNAYFYRGPDYFLLSAIVILLTGIFAQEFGKNPFAQILRATKRGRGETWHAKLTVGLASAAACVIVSEAAALFTVWRRFGLYGFSAPVASIEKFSAVGSGTTVAEYFCIFLAVRIFAALALALIVFCLSELTRRAPAVVTAAAAITLLPAAGVRIGFEAGKSLDFLLLFEAQGALSASVSAGNGKWTQLITVTAALSAALALSTFLTRLHYAGHKKRRHRDHAHAAPAKTSI